MRTLLTHLLFVVVIVGGVACGQGSSEGQQPPFNRPPQPAPSTPPPQAAPSVDLVIVGVSGTTMQGQRVIQVNIQNIGPSTATGVSGVCSYRCESSGVSVNNQSFLEGGYLSPGKGVTSSLAVTPCADRSLLVQCTIDPGNAVQETNELNNSSVATVNFPSQ